MNFFSEEQTPNTNKCVVLRKQLKTTYVRQFELRIYIYAYTYTHTYTRNTTTFKKSTAEWSSNRLQKRTRWQSFHPPTLGNQTPGLRERSLGRRPI